MRILIAGNMDYVGPILTRFLRENVKNAELIGFRRRILWPQPQLASAFTRGPLGPARVPRKPGAAGCLARRRRRRLHLSAVSNESMGDKFEAGDINEKAGVRIARLAAERGVKSFVFALSCSM